jgi:predicted Zn-dependent protease
MEKLLLKEDAYHLFTRRDFLKIASYATVGLAAGCATNPVTGKTEFMLVGENTEIKVDKENSPSQFSADYGPVQDKKLNNYINRTGKKMAALTHRPNLPYSFRGVNATYVNAYTFPAGSVGVTRGILLSLENEAELTALLGHELGHVNARHTAKQMSKSMLTQALVGGVSAYVGTVDPAYADLSSKIGMIGAGALLASYSRDNEREADALGLEYMVKSGYSPSGFEGLMDMLRNLSKHKPNAIELMFATHPMSDERYKNTIKTIKSKYSGNRKNPVYRERYMDNTAGVRKIKDAIEKMQNGEKYMAGGKFGDAEQQFKSALKQATKDYAGLLMMAKCQLVQKKFTEAERFADKAKSVYPEEAQARNINGFIKVQRKKYPSALKEFNAYDRLLPGNINITFFRGYCFEGMRKKDAAAKEYVTYLKAVNQGEKAQHAYKKLVEWGYVKQGNS